MCEPGITKAVRVKIPADLSSTGKAKWKTCHIDFCIADLVEALQRGGVDMRGSCCGHYLREGNIALQDGRGLLVLSQVDFRQYMRLLDAGTPSLVTLLEIYAEGARL